MSKQGLTPGTFVEVTSRGKKSAGRRSVGIIHDEGEQRMDRRFYPVESGPNGEIMHNVPDVEMGTLEDPGAQQEAVEQARRQGILEVALGLKDTLDKSAWALSRIDGRDGSIEKPGTGIFVVVGVYSDDEERRSLNAVVKTDPSTTEEALAKGLWDFSERFETIPMELRVPGEMFPEVLEGYQCYELPEAATNLIDWEVPEV